MIPTSPPAIYAPARIDERRMLHAIAEVETGNRWGVVGRHGEHSPWQMKESVWDQHLGTAGYPFRIFRDNRPLARMCAKMHLRWLEEHLWLRGIEVTPRNVATCWRLGLEGGAEAVRDRRWPDSADRVANIYEENP